MQDKAPRTCVVALGTRGDVQPLALLALALLEAEPAACIFVTHAAHEGWLSAQVQAHRAQLRLVLLEDPPARRWLAGSGEVGAAAAGSRCMRCCCKKQWEGHAY
jgi:hypothetical protein